VIIELAIESGHSSAAGESGSRKSCRPNRRPTRSKARSAPSRPASDRELAGQHALAFRCARSSDTQSGGTSPFSEHRLNTRTARLTPAASPGADRSPLSATGSSRAPPRRTGRRPVRRHSARPLQQLPDLHQHRVIPDPRAVSSSRCSSSCRDSPWPAARPGACPASPATHAGPLSLLSPGPPRKPSLPSLAGRSKTGDPGRGGPSTGDRGGPMARARTFRRRSQAPGK
jgi:hypothetical protein